MRVFGIFQARLDTSITLPSPADGRSRLIDIDRLVEDPHNARRRFAQASLDEHTATIRTDGVIEPLVVVARDDARYLIRAPLSSLCRTARSGWQYPERQVASNHLRLGYSERTTDPVQAIAGLPSHMLTQYPEDHRAAWRG